MADNRLTRELETRESTQRKKAWTPPQLLPEPKPQPGWKFKYVRISTFGQMDPTNSGARFREGWEPVPIEEQPQFKLLVDPNSRYKDQIEIGGLLLCKTPEEFVKQRNDYYSKQAQAQTESVDNTLMRQSDPRMPLFNERKSSTTFGKGS